MTRRTYRAGDEELWDDVARTVVPLKKRGARPKAILVSAPKQTPPRVYHPPAELEPPAQKPSARPSTAPPPLTGLDRRTGQRMTRGKVDIESRIDLHGTGAEEARMRLFGFIRSERAAGARTVLVITGKGGSPYARHTLHGASHFHAPERAGRLRRLVPDWLHEAEFRAHVAGFQPAHPRHGGGGAFYVQLRRARAP
jgi:DNA-nicking Smr family endonuclease